MQHLFQSCKKLFVKPAKAVALFFGNFADDFHGFGFANLAASGKHGIEEGHRSDIGSSEGGAFYAGKERFVCDTGERRQEGDINGYPTRRSSDLLLRPFTRLR